MYIYMGVGWIVGWIVELVGSGELAIQIFETSD
jgi:hypothetical protein